MGNLPKGRAKGEILETITTILVQKGISYILWYNRNNAKCNDRELWDITFRVDSIPINVCVDAYMGVKSIDMGTYTKDRLALKQEGVVLHFCYLNYGRSLQIINKVLQIAKDKDMKKPIYCVTQGALYNTILDKLKKRIVNINFCKV